MTCNSTGLAKEREYNQLYDDIYNKLCILCAHTTSHTGTAVGILHNSSNGMREPKPERHVAMITSTADVISSGRLTGILGSHFRLMGHSP